jgi:hypothetical protein
MSSKIDRNEEANLVPRTVAITVEAFLKLGRVPPIFHAYCARFFVDYDSRRRGAAEDEDATEDEYAISPDDQKLGSWKPNDRETMINQVRLAECTKDELKKMLQSLGLKVGGNKQELIDRITGATASAPPGAVEAIEKQKTRALALWDTVCAGPPHVVAAYGGDGQVPPICLAYGPRLFAERDNSPHVLSAEPVTRGECKKGKKGTLQMSANKYESAFLYTDRRGKHCANEEVRDDGLRAHPFVWTFDSDLTDAFAN